MPNLDLFLLLGIIAFTIAAFAREWMPIDMVALASLALLLLTGILTPEEAISGFSNPAVITVMMMFILSESLVHSGLVTKMGYQLSNLTGSSRWSASVLLLVVVGILSAFINNTAAVTVFMPVAIHLANHYEFSPSKILLPLSYTAIIGGTMTLIGTSTNLLVSSLAASEGSGPFSVFEFMYLGGILFVVGLIYNILVPLKYLPSRSILSSLTRKYHLSDYLTELRIPSGSKLAGRTVVEEQVSQRHRLTVLEILRGERKIALDIRNTRIKPDDILILEGAMEDILSFKERFGLLLLTDVKLDDSDLSDENTILAEVQLSPTSRLVGSNLKELDFRRSYGCFVLALGRTGASIRRKLAHIPLKHWDTLLVFGPKSRVEALYQREDFLPLGEFNLRFRLSRKWWISAVMIPLVVLLAATGVMSILKAAIIGVAVLLVTRCLTMQQAYRSIDWTVIFLLAATVPLGIAMQKTGLADLIGLGLSQVGEAAGPMVLLSVLYLATSLLTSVFSNNATAVLMVSISSATAHQLGISAKPLLMAVAFAASASFMSPVGYQTNAMVLGPGNYRFSDYLKFGAPLNLLFWILSSLLIPVFWPF
jgi:di/tricarboxylate transporter